MDWHAEDALGGLGDRPWSVNKRPLDSDTEASESKARRSKDEAKDKEEHHQLMQSAWILDTEPETVRMEPSSYLYYGSREYRQTKEPLPYAQQKFLETFALFRPEMAKWLAKYETNVRYDHETNWILDYYVGTFSDCFYQWYRDGKPLDHAKLKSPLRLSMAQKFDALWSNPKVFRFLPKGGVLFEGQRTTKDLVGAQQGHILRRLRPSSTSWQLNVALWFANGAEHGMDTPGATATLLVHEIVDDFVRTIYVPPHYSHYPASDSNGEYETLLQPGIRIEVTKVLESYPFPIRNIQNPYQLQSLGSVRVVFTRVSRL